METSIYIYINMNIYLGALEQNVVRSAARTPVEHDGLARELLHEFVALHRQDLK